MSEPKKFDQWIELLVLELYPKGDPTKLGRRADHGDFWRAKAAIIQKAFDATMLPPEEAAVMRALQARIMQTRVPAEEPAERITKAELQEQLVAAEECVAAEAETPITVALRLKHLGARIFASCPIGGWRELRE